MYQFLPVGRYCYLDTDIVAVHSGIDEIFNIAQAPIAFAADIGNLSNFSRYAVNCGCALPCNHLERAIFEEFDVTITAPNWQHWNSGVFVFNTQDSAFLHLWHSFCLTIFKKTYWSERDQGALIAAAWKNHLQDIQLLPREYNYIVDCFSKVDKVGRSQLAPEEFDIDDTYSLDDKGDKPRPRFLHLIHGAVGKNGWKNWDQAVALVRNSK
jgi:hypothetical protein